MDTDNKGKWSQTTIPKENHYSAPYCSGDIYGYFWIRRM